MITQRNLTSRYIILISFLLSISFHQVIAKQIDQFQFTKNLIVQPQLIQDFIDPSQFTQDITNQPQFAQGLTNQPRFAETPTPLDNLTCKNFRNIKSLYLAFHIVTDIFTDLEDLEWKTIERFLNAIDPNKIYFLQSDIDQIKNNIHMFSSIKDCEAIDTLYNVYRQRVHERRQEVDQYLANFQLNQNAAYVHGVFRKHAGSPQEMKSVLQSYLQVRVAAYYQGSKTTKNIEESIKSVAREFRHAEERSISYQPVLTQEEIQECLKKNENLYIHCKPHKWYSLYLNSFSKSLDPHSSYMDRSEVRRLEHPQLFIQGIGVNILFEYGWSIIENVIPNSPASRAGLQPGDIITAVGQTVYSLRDVYGKTSEYIVDLVKGRVGTPVYLKIKRQNSSFVVTATRGHIERRGFAISNTNLMMIDKNINGQTYKVGVISLARFYKTGMGSSIHDLRNLITNAESQGAKSIVLDLSTNPGGLITEAVGVAGLFIAKGNITALREGGPYSKIYPRIQTYSDPDSALRYSGPLVVLVNGYSASASELVSGTLQDYRRAIIVGSPTYGKGTAQSKFSPSQDRTEKLGFVKVTFGMYFTPSGSTPQKTGVIPNIHLPQIDSLFTQREEHDETVLEKDKISPFASPDSEIFTGNPTNDWKPVTDTTINYLKNLSQQRVANNYEFQEVIQKNKEINFQKREASISVKEILQTNREENLNFFNNQQSMRRNLTNIRIQEAAQIAADLADFQSKELLSHQSNF